MLDKNKENSTKYAIAENHLDKKYPLKDFVQKYNLKLQPGGLDFR